MLVGGAAAARCRSRRRCSGITFPRACARRSPTSRKPRAAWWRPSLAVARRCRSRPSASASSPCALLIAVADAADLATCTPHRGGVAPSVADAAPVRSCSATSIRADDASLTVVAGLDRRQMDLETAREVGAGAARQRRGRGRRPERRRAARAASGCCRKNSRGPAHEAIDLKRLAIVGALRSCVGRSGGGAAAPRPRAGAGRRRRPPPTRQA